MSILLMIATAFEWFAGTKIGRIVGLAALVLGAAVFAYFKVKGMGRAEEREKIKKETDKLINEKDKIDASVDSATDAELTDRMQPWIRKRG